MGNDNWKCDGKKSLSRDRHRWKCIIKMDIKGIVWEGVFSFIWLIFHFAENKNY
jgi:hypothetical protein